MCPMHMPKVACNICWVSKFNSWHQACTPTSKKILPRNQPDRNQWNLHTVELSHAKKCYSGVEVLYLPAHPLDWTQPTSVPSMSWGNREISWISSWISKNCLDTAYGSDVDAVYTIWHIMAQKILFGAMCHSSSTTAFLLSCSLHMMLNGHIHAAF